MIKTFINDMQLPINPLNDITFEVTMNSKSIDLVSFGEIVKIGNRKPIKLTIDSIFTDKSYPFVVVTNPLLAIDYVNNLYTLLNKKDPVRFIITGDLTDINMLCLITGFKHTQKFGEEGEYYYTIELTEFRNPQAKKVIIQSDSAIPLGQADISQSAVRSEKTVQSQSYTVKKNDCLWNIAKLYYGDGSKYPLILSANPSIKDNKIYAGQILSIPSTSSASASNQVSNNYFNPGISDLQTSAGKTLGYGGTSGLQTSAGKALGYGGTSGLQTTAGNQLGYGGK